VATHDDANPAVGYNQFKYEQYLVSSDRRRRDNRVLSPCTDSFNTLKRSWLVCNVEDEPWRLLSFPLCR
jgi:hypothetical protein